MKAAIILHGMPSKAEHYRKEGKSNSNKHWLPWIQHELIIHDILAQTPEFPHPYNPVYEGWFEVFQRFEINEDTMLVGHSCGAGFLIRFLSENNVKVGKVALVAPWLDPHKTLKTGFFDFEIDKEMVKKTAGIKIFFSTDDSQDVTVGTNYLREKLKDVEVEEFNDKGHFCFEDMQTEKFPELRTFLL